MFHVHCALKHKTQFFDKVIRRSVHPLHVFIPVYFQFTRNTTTFSKTQQPEGTSLEDNLRFQPWKDTGPLHPQQLWGNQKMLTPQYLSTQTHNILFAYRAPQANNCRHLEGIWQPTLHKEAPTQQCTTLPANKGVKAEKAKHQMQLPLEWRLQRQQLELRGVWKGLRQSWAPVRQQLGTGTSFIVPGNSAAVRIWWVHGVTDQHPDASRTLPHRRASFSLC